MNTKIEDFIKTNLSELCEDYQSYKKTYNYQSTSKLHELQCIVIDCLGNNLVKNSLDFTLELIAQYAVNFCVENRNKTFVRIP